MNIITTQPIATNSDNSRNVTTLISELKHYKKQSENLLKFNLLHQRLSGILDLPTMIETYSIWIMEHISHDLIGYYNAQYQKMHMYCSSHGPERRRTIKITQSLLKQQHLKSETIANIDGLQTFSWAVNEKNDSGRFVIVKKENAFTESELSFLNDTLAILNTPLQRALEFEQLFRQVRKDTLTGLPNRFVLEERIDAIIEQAKRYNHPLTLASLDLDFFKAVNDTMGHLQGDKILQDVAKALEKEIRQTDLLVRMGGDEFLLILPDTGIRAAEHLSQRLCAAIEQLNVTTREGKLGVSIGLAEWRNELSKEEWFEKADDTLYQAKAQGKARVIIN